MILSLLNNFLSSFVNNTLEDCLLKLDIFHNRHVLEKFGRIQERRKKKTKRWHTYIRTKKEIGREDWEKRSEIMEEAYEKMKKGIIPFLFSPSTWTLCIQKKRDINSRKQRSVCLLTDLMYEVNKTILKFDEWLINYRFYDSQ